MARQDITDTARTLPMIAVPSLLGVQHETLLLTIIFHADMDRIGQVAEVPADREVMPWIFGRNSPPFGPPGNESGTPLGDPHVSRRALEFKYTGGKLTIQQCEGSNRCQLDSEPLLNGVELEPGQLRAGVPLFLAHSTVLLLRLVPAINCSFAHTDCEHLKGRSASMGRLREQVAEAAACDADVLIRGESGTGKELVAKTIHQVSRRRAAPLVAVNMAAISADLTAAALFGTARGAYTGADRDKRGYFDQAAGGTLFLDEIGDIAAEVQPQLLRALQEREIQPVGGAVRRVDLRIVSATDAPIEAAEYGFKAALRHRLGALEIRVPALREHPEDIGELLSLFLGAEAGARGESGPCVTMGSPAVLVAAWAHFFYQCLLCRWPGNVRQLANAARQVRFDRDGAPVLTESLQETLADRRCPTGERSVTAVRRPAEIGPEAFDRAMQDGAFEPQRVAQLLGVSRAAVYRRIEASDVYRLAHQIEAEEIQRVLDGAADDLAVAARTLQVSRKSLRGRLRHLGWTRPSE